MSGTKDEMHAWTVDRVLALAPDTSSVASGRQLANPAKWASAAQSQTAVWGEAKGSGAKPYQTAVDLREPAFKCSCPSRKFPCKHALGLLLRFAEGQVPPGEPPNWLTEWLEKRDAKAANQQAAQAVPSADTESDPEAAAKRAAKRWSTILSGLDECEAFLIDSASHGLLVNQATRDWDQMAARMVDAQAPGVARRLHEVANRVGVGPDWHLDVGGRLGGLALLIEAARRLDTLPDDLQADVRSTLGIPLLKDELRGEVLKDTWDVLGQYTVVEDRLRMCRSWLRGRTSGRWAMHLAFSAGSRPFDVLLQPQTSFEASVVFYPSAWPLRVHLEERTEADFAPLTGGTWADATSATAIALARQPWAEWLPVHLTQAQLAFSDGQWLALDSVGESVPLADREPFRFLAESANTPSELFGEWDGHKIRLLGTWGPWGATAR